jgi:putative transposase
MEWNSFSHSYGESYLHLQFTPKYRRRVFEDKTIKRACKNLMLWIASRLKIVIEAIEFGPEHMHVFIKNWKNYSIEFLAQQLKGRSSFEIRRRLPNELRRFKLGYSFWSDGYFHETVGSVTAEARKFYIQRCQDEHWKGIDYLTYKQLTQPTLINFFKPSGL